MRQPAQVSPELFWETITAFQRTAALKAAVELDVFTKIADGSQTASEIAAACQAAERGIRILCDAITVMGFLKKDGDGYDLNEMSALFLNRHSPAYLGGSVDFILSPTQKLGFENLTEAVRRGGSVVSDEGALDPESPMWVKFARGMTGMMMPSAQQMTERIGFETDRKINSLRVLSSVFAVAFRT